jgi:hypothetical protein
MSLRTSWKIKEAREAHTKIKEAKEAHQKNRKRKKRKKEKKEKGKKKIGKGHCYYHLPHLCFKVAPCFSYRESPMLSLSYTSGNFHSMHTHLVFILSFHTLIALSASIAWQSLLTHVNINWWTSP